MEHDPMAHEDLTQEDKSKRKIDLFQRLVMHHAIWSGQADSRMGTDISMETLWNISEKDFGIQMKCFAGQTGAGTDDKRPALLSNQDDCTGDDQIRNP